MLGHLAIALLAAYLLIAEPLLGRRGHRRMLAALNAGKAGARLHFYLRWTWQGWALVAVTLLVTLGLADWTPTQLGLVMPTWPHGPDLAAGAALDLLQGAAIGAGMAIVLVAIRALIAARTRGKRAARPRGRVANRAVLAMLPRTGGERWGWAALSITAGIGEEIVWRGFGLGLLFMLLPGAHPVLPIALAAAAFGWAHFYQGTSGIAITAVLGALLAILYWASGSLLWPIVVHALPDLAALFSRLPAAPVATGDHP